MSLTSAQQQAITARGNVLLVAGAGAGKTSTLVARCLHCLLEEQRPASLDELLLVTFTEAAAADMRRKIRAEFERRLRDLDRSQPAAARVEKQLTEQLALFDAAHIGTLHSFCLQLVRQHFYELELDPQLAVLPEEEERLLANETLEKILRDHYASDSPDSKAVQLLIQTQGRGWDLPIRTLILKLHHYSQTLRDPQAWFAAQTAMFESPEPVQWAEWLVAGVRDWRDRWLPALQSLSTDNTKAAECASALAKLPAQPSRPECAAALACAFAADQEWPRGKKTIWRKPLDDFFDEAAFLHSLVRTDRPSDPLAEDWSWVRSQMLVLLRLAREFTARFTDAKRELGMVDFHDLEQYALRVLAVPDVARQWREKLRFVFVDEYQDINDAQDAILKALSGEGPKANRFLVGDVKQSIYRFRLANPHIFQNYVATWSAGDGRIIPLADNFRSRESIIRFINSVFAVLMRREIGGVGYNADAQLRFGDAANRRVLSLAHDPSPRVEFHLRLRGSADDVAPEDGADNTAWAEITNLEDTDKEARLVALRLRELKESCHAIWDEATKAMRPVEWRDVAILLRSPSRKAESYAKEFSRLGIPLLVARGGFYESMEITDLLSLLQVLDNPLQDLPLLAVLRSPLVGLSLNELAAIRLLLPRGHFWAALQRSQTVKETAKATRFKVERFLKRFAAWRRLARQASLSHCLESVLSETHYSAWLLAQSRGAQRNANVQRLLGLARQFDRFQRQGLFRFLRFIEAQQAAETEPEVAPASAENSVSLMSIHQSKGLEFPVVVVADLGKPFNLSDLRADIILDELFGLCPQVKPPHTGRRYPSLPYWLARQRQKRETLGEELRLLYVAMTRARDTLILTGTIAAREFEKRWQEPGSLNTTAILAARNYLDWLAAWSRISADTLLRPPNGENSFLRWTIYEDDRHLIARTPAESTDTTPGESSYELDPARWRQLEQRLAWQYPHAAATHAAAKTSVSVLRRLAAEAAEESRPLFRSTSRRSRATANSGAARLTAAEIGSAHHTFLEFVSLEQTGTLAALQAEARRLADLHALSADQIAHLDFPALLNFWQSDLGRDIRAQSARVHRELPFTARFRPDELPPSTPEGSKSLDGEYVVVQGVADLMVLLSGEIWLVDFKTDEVSERELPEKIKIYEPQLNLYALALNRIYRLPVTRLYLHFLALHRTVPLQSPALQP